MAFVGRDPELEQLLAALEESAAGRGRVVLIAGEPGIGKSRLADELGRRAREQGISVLWGRGWEDAGAPPYWPWIQALRAHVRDTAADDLREQLGDAAADVAHILPEVVAAVADVTPSADSESDSARFQLFDSIASFLRRASAGRPMLVVLDDLHAADTVSLLLLRFLARQAGEMRLMVVATYRDIELTPEHPLSPVVADLAREPTTRIVTLGGLPPSAVGRYIGETAGVTPHDLVVAAVWRETNGNPLFVGEAVRLLTAEGRLADMTDLPTLRVAVPAGVREVITRRVGHLSQDAQRLMTIGSVLGPEFRVEVMRRLADMPADRAVDLLEEAVRTGLLAPVSGTLDRYRFSHDLVRETLYDVMPDGERAALHRKAVDVLESLPGRSADDHLAELAFHAYASLRGVERTEKTAAFLERTVDYARRAGDRAARSLAYEEAARLYRVALSALDHEGAGEGDRAELVLAMGDAMAREGDLAGSRATYLEAAEIARRTGAAAQLARAALGFGGRLPWARPGKDRRLIPLLQDALVLLGGQEPRLRVRLLTRLACAYRSSPGELDKCRTLGRQAVELAQGLEDPATLSYAMAGLYWAMWGPEDSEERLGIAEEMLGLAGSLGDAERLVDAHVMLFLSYLELGRMGEARVKLRDVSRLATDLRQPAQLWLGVAPRALVALMDGEFALAESLITVELQPSTPHTLAEDETSAATFHQFLLRREQGRPAEAVELVRAAAENYVWYPLHRAALALLLVDLARHEEAESIFNDLSQDSFAALYRDNEWLLGMGLVSEACTLVGDEPAARVLYEQLLPFAGRHAIGAGEGSVGAVDRYLGLLARQLGDEVAAERHLHEALRLNQHLGARPWVAHTQHDLGSLLVGRGGRDRARGEQQLRDALEMAERIGMAALARKISGGAAGPAVKLAPSAPSPGGTFRAEGEYWTVALDGRSVRIRNTKGMGYLARLLASPGQELHALDLAGAAGTTPGRVRRAAVTNGDGLDADPFGNAGPLLDPEAKASYRSRLTELDEELAQADEWNDSERAARLREEKSLIVAELSHAVGLGGRDRQSGSAAERARLSVTRAVRSAVQRISQQHPALGEHLDATIRTGTFCSYTPDPRAEVTWDL